MRGTGAGVAVAVVGRNLGQHLRRILAPVLLLALLAGCAVQLAPSFDRTILDGLARANEEALVLYASVADGTTADDYRVRADSYNTVIGAFDAVRIQTGARPVPRPRVFRLFGWGSEEEEEEVVEPDAISRLQTPTPAILERIVANITRLRDRDRAEGLTPAVVTGLKQSYEISIDQALTYERALER